MEPGVTVVKSDFADVILPHYGTTKILKYTLCNNFMSVDIINYGATIVGIHLPNSNGKKENVILGYDSISGYLNLKNPYFGATIGRYGHKIFGASFVQKDRTYYLSKNDGNHSYHGGVQGFNKKVWDSRIESNGVMMTYKSYDLEEGYPGDLNVSVRFVLTNRNQLIVVYKALPTNMTTPVNIMNQIYFNLSGDMKKDSPQHMVKVDSEFVAIISPESGTPTGYTEQITGSPMDIRKYVLVSEIPAYTSNRLSVSDKSVKSREDVTIAARESTKDTIPSDSATNNGVTSGQNFGVYYCIEGLGLRPHAKLKYEPSGRSVQIFSNQPCLYLSFGQELSDLPAKYGKWGPNAGILIQPGNFPDAVHHEKFPTPWVSPGETYQHTILYKFRVSGLDCSEDEDGLPKKAEESEENFRKRCFDLVEPDKTDEANTSKTNNMT